MHGLLNLVVDNNKLKVILLLLDDSSQNLFTILSVLEDNCPMLLELELSISKNARSEENVVTRFPFNFPELKSLALYNF